MSSANTVHVTNIAEGASDEEIREFFTFCGKISDIKVTTDGKTRSASVTFETETAAKTALLLNRATFHGNEIEVTSPAGATLDEESHPKHHGGDSEDIAQEEKPRTRILAEYLAHGYVVADAGLQRAIALDEKHGVSSRFMKTLQNLDEKYHATDRAKTADKSYGISERANHLWNGLGSYFEKASNTPTGKRLVQFYTDGSRQVSDIHSEAKRLAELKKQAHGGSSYKAAGFERVFGPEKTTRAGDVPGAAPSNAPATESSQPPTAPANVAGNNETVTPIPK